MMHPYPSNQMQAPRGRIPILVLRLGQEARALFRLPVRYGLATLIVAPMLVWAALHYRVNVSASLPWSVARIEYGRVPARGDYMIYRYRGDLPGLPSHTFFKRVAGVAGDTIRVVGRTVWVDDRLIGVAQAMTHAGIVLAPIAPGVIPQGYLFAQGDNPASFDSRYAEEGLVPVDSVLGVAYPVF